MQDQATAFVVTTKRLTLAAATTAANVAIAVAAGRGLRMTVAVLDAGSELLQLSRMDGANAGTVEVAIAKARCAAKFNRPTKDFSELYRNGATALIGLPNMVTFEGGIPVVIDNILIGAIGASGASPDLDGIVASAGLEAIMQNLR
jgi:glc operon protein GlcG